MANRKRKRQLRFDLDVNNENFPDSPTFVGCGMSAKRYRKAILESSIPTLKRIASPNLRHSSNGWKRTLRRKVSMSIKRQKLKSLQDYSLPSERSLNLVRSVSDCSLRLRSWSWQISAPYILPEIDEEHEITLHILLQDHDLQQKIDHEIKMRDGTAKLLAASKHPTQLLEAAKNLLCSNTRIIAYMTELQRRKTEEVLGKTNSSSDGNQLPCKAKLSISDLRIPLMWKNTDHFKNKGDHRRYAVFCLLRIGTDIYDTKMLTNVDRSMTDIAFDDVIVFNGVANDFDCKMEIYCHKLHEDMTMASTPKKLRKRINNISGSVGRSVGKRLSGLKDDAEIIGSMVLGPRFELMATGKLNLCDVDDCVRTYDLELKTPASGTTLDGLPCELPLFGHYCCRVAALPACLLQPAVSGYLNLQEDDDLSKWKRYWCLLKNLQLACWSSPSDVEVTQPLFTIPVTKNTQISDADPRTCKRSHTFHLQTVQGAFISEHTLAAESKEELSQWWDGFQQHLLDQAFWKHACEHMMDVRHASPRRLPAFMRKGSLYDETPINDPTSYTDSVINSIQMDDTQLSQMLSTLMGEAKQIRGEHSSSSIGSSHSADT